MHAHAHEVFRACLLVETDEIVRIKLVSLPGFDYILETKLRWMAIGLHVMFVLPFAFDIHPARVPVTVLGGRLRPPVRPDAKLRVTVSLGNAVSLERFTGRLERARLN